MPVDTALGHTADSLRARTLWLAEQCGGRVVASDGLVGGGSRPGERLPGVALLLAGGEALLRALRLGNPPVIARLDDGVHLDLRCVPPDQDPTLLSAIRRALGQGAG